jgi:hypothetical protein
MSEITEVINIPNLMTELLKMYEVKREGELSKLELALGKEGAKKALQGAAEALKKHLHPSILPWRHDIADAQRVARQVMVDMAAAAHGKDR